DVVLSAGEAMRRREFITLIGSLSIVWPSVARGQQAQKVPLVGVLMPFEKGDEEAERRQSAFQNGLAQFGWRNGQNIRRWRSKSLSIPRCRFGGSRPGRDPSYGNPCISRRSRANAHETNCVCTGHRSSE